VRHRVLESKLGRWTKRDPLGYVDGASLFGYSTSMPVAYVDPLGLCLGCLAIVLAIKSAEPRDCSGFDQAFPPNTWTVPGRVPVNPATPPNYPEFQYQCGKFSYPSPMLDSDCYCWERRRIIQRYGYRAWIKVADCGNLARQTAGGLANDDLCENNFRHCLWACCLFGHFGGARARDILWAHECCYLHTRRSPNWDDVDRDLLWSENGITCWPIGGSGDTSDITSRCRTCCWVKIRNSGCNVGACLP
jgi:hypothetical protein